MMPSSRSQMAAWTGWAVVAAVAVACVVFSASLGSFIKFPREWMVPIATWLGDISEAGAETVRPASRSLAWLLEQPMLAIRDVLQWLPWPVTIIFTALLAWRSRAGPAVVVVTIASLTYILVSGYWVQTMNTLALVAVAVPLSILVGLAAGVAAHYSKGARIVVMPALDLMQTMPTFAYLIPILFLFGFGPVVGLIASAIFAAPPMVRNVMLGLSRVSSEVVEAGRIAGTSARQQLFWVELPAALQQLKVGLNQTIMAALSMVIIAAVIGGFDDIGWEVLASMRKARFGDSLLAGSVIVLIAVVMDRISAAFADGSRPGPTKGIGGKPARSKAANRALLLMGGLVLIAAGKALDLVPPQNVEWVRILGANIDASLTQFVGDFGDALTTIKNQSFYYYLLPVRIGFSQTIAPFTWGFALTPEMKWGYGIVTSALSALLFWRFSWRAAVGFSFAAYVLWFGLSGVPWVVLCGAALIIAHATGGPRVAAFVGAVAAFILVTGLWDQAMLSIYLCGSAALIAFVLGAALGTAGALSARFSSVL
ncbi:MAG: ABC transporter permease subunit, partial [Chromatiales bacterium]|nr:ABC transporter permease subunit [Chromatiales bacterium]